MKVGIFTLAASCCACWSCYRSARLAWTRRSRHCYYRLRHSLRNPGQRSCSCPWYPQTPQMTTPLRQIYSARFSRIPAPGQCYLMPSRCIRKEAKRCRKERKHSRGRVRSRGQVGDSCKYFVTYTALLVIGLHMFPFGSRV